MAWIRKDPRTGNLHLQYRLKTPDGKNRPKSKKLGPISMAEAKIALARFMTSETYLRLDIKAPKFSITIEKLIHEFGESLKLRVCADSHKRQTGLLNRCLKPFFNRDPSQLFPDDIRKICKEKNYKVNTSRLVCQAVTGLYKFATSQGYLNTNPMAGLKSPSREVLPPRAVDPSLIHQLLESMTGHVRDFYTILHYTGMRPSEALRLQGRDVGECIIVRTSKTKRFRALPIHEALQPILKKLSKGKKAEDYLFPSGDTHQKNMISAFKRAKTRAKIKDSISPYCFRHTFATEILRKTGNIRVAQTLLGHTSIAMTERYAHALPEALRASVNMLE